MTQELQRDDSLPYREYIMRPTEILDFGIEWVGWLANRWFTGFPYSAGSVIRPRKPTGLEYITTAGGLSGSATAPLVEPAWPAVIGGQVTDGAVTWTAQAASTASLISTISSSPWSVDSPITVGTPSLSGTRSIVLASVPANTPDGDYYLRNTITLANSVQKIGLFLLRVRAAAL